MSTVLDLLRDDNADVKLSMLNGLTKIVETIGEDVL